MTATTERTPALGPDPCPTCGALPCDQVKTPIEAGLREKVEVAGQAAEQRFRGSGLSTAFLAGAQAMKTAILSALQSETKMKDPE